MLKVTIAEKRWSDACCHRSSFGVSKVTGKGNKGGFKYCWRLSVPFMHYFGITLAFQDTLLSIVGLSRPGQCFKVLTFDGGNSSKIGALKPRCYIQLDLRFK